jgi:glycosyltransferase involved in cell wall biosynthesis
VARFAIVNNFFPPRASGSAHLSEAEAAGLVERGHDVLVITAAYGDLPATEKRDGYDIVRLPSWTLPKLKFAFNFDISFTLSPRNVRRLFDLLDEFSPDAIHQHGQFFDLTFMSSLYARRRRTPVLLSIHTRLESPSRPQNLVFALGDRTLVRFFMALSRPHVVVMDRLMLGYITSRYAIPQDRLIPIPVGVDPNRFGAADGDAVRKDLGVTGRPVVLSIGHVIPVRDRITLVRAMAQVVEARPDVVLVVVGGVYDDRFLDEADRLGIRGSVITTGPVPKESIPGYVAAADVETHDLDGYGLGTASLEVMAAGVPTIAGVAADNFLGFELRNWEDVVLVRPGDHRQVADAILRLLSEPGLAQKVASGQRQLIDRRFSTDIINDAQAEALASISR